MKIDFGKSILYTIILILVLSFASSYFSMQRREVKEVPISEVAQGVAEGNISEVTVKDNKVTAVKTNGDKIRSIKEPGISLTEYGITPDKTKIDVKDTSGTAAWFSVLSLALPLLVIGGLIWFILGMNLQN